MGFSILNIVVGGMMSMMLHPVHVSVTTVDVKTDSGKVCVQIKLFTNDIQQVVNNFDSANLQLGTKAEQPKAYELIADYLTNRLFIEINKKPVILRFVDRRMNEESVWISFEGDLADSKHGAFVIKSAIIENTILLDLYEDQSNLLIFGQGNGTEKGYMMNIGNVKQTIEL